MPTISHGSSGSGETPGDAQSEAARDWLAAVFASSAAVIVGGDDQGRIVVWSGAAERFYGYTRDEVLGKPLAMLKSDDVPDLGRMQERVLEGETIPPTETRHRRKDGTVVDVQVTISPVEDAEGRVIGSSAIVRDITDAKSHQAALEHAVVHERLIVEKLTDLDRVRTSFVSSVSHELRTPLTSILGYLELLMEDPAGRSAMNEHQREMLDIVSRNSKRLLALIEDLLVLSRIETGAFRVLKEPVDVRALVNAVAREVGPKVAAASHDLSVSVADDVGSVLGDPGELERLLLAILSNAIKFTPPGGEIAIMSDVVEGGIRIQITDTGIGIPPQEVECVFDPFFRSDAADRRAIGGTGLGLPIAMSIVEQHGGSISCKSDLGVGTRMTVILPFAIQDRRAS